MVAGFTTSFLLCSLAIAVLSSPLRQIHLRQLPPIVQMTWVTSVSTAEVQETTTVAETFLSTLAPTGNTLAGQQMPFLLNAPEVVTITSDMLSITTATDIETLTDYLTSTVNDQASTVTLTAAPTPTTATVTSTVVVSETFIATPGSFWSTPKQFSDLDTFKVVHFADGESNLQVMNSMPPNVSDDVLGISLPALGSIDELTAPLASAQDPLVPSDSVLQLFYPKSSVNPDQKPIGGADFYATPLPLDDANNVTLEYGVFFPSDFNWMQGGKLPGLYGGHEECSGGDAAISCFSTRLMWRDGGKGELYLVSFQPSLVYPHLKRMSYPQYAPKDKQTSSLCRTPPQSVCDADYGLSIGRGSFDFAAGNWTTVRQTVSLNTPGKQDGGFALHVNGQLIMERDDVFYRDVPPPSSAKTSSSHNTPSTTSASAPSDPTEPSSAGLLSPLLGNEPILGRPPVLGSGTPLLGGVLQSPDGSEESQSGSEDGVADEGAVSSLAENAAPLATVGIASYPSDSDYPLSQPESALSPMASILWTAGTQASAVPSSGPAVIQTSEVEQMNSQPTTAYGSAAQSIDAGDATVTVSSYVWPNMLDSVGKVVAGKAGDAEMSKPIAFSGLFFSTFFGGNSPEYATPKDQYTWFKDFSITINS